VRNTTDAGQLVHESFALNFFTTRPVNRFFPNLAEESAKSFTRTANEKNCVAYIADLFSVHHERMFPVLQISPV
jgi:hypothetical protein